MSSNSCSFATIYSEMYLDLKVWRFFQRLCILMLDTNTSSSLFLPVPLPGYELEFSSAHPLWYWWRSIWAEVWERIWSFPTLSRSHTLQKTIISTAWKLSELYAGFTGFLYGFHCIFNGSRLHWEISFRPHFLFCLISWWINPFPWVCDNTYDCIISFFASSKTKKQERSEILWPKLGKKKFYFLWWSYGWNYEPVSKSKNQIMYMVTSQLSYFS